MGALRKIPVTIKIVIIKQNNLYCYYLNVLLKKIMIHAKCRSENNEIPFNMHY